MRVMVLLVLVLVLVVDRGFLVGGLGFESGKRVVGW